LSELLDDEYKSGLGNPNPYLEYCGLYYYLREKSKSFYTSICKATRFGDALTGSADKLKEQLLNEYRSKHNGKLPVCIEEEKSN
jgi:hypothetical protein